MSLRDSIANDKNQMRCDESWGSDLPIEKDIIIGSNVRLVSDLSSANDDNGNTDSALFGNKRGSASSLELGSNENLIFDETIATNVELAESVMIDSEPETPEEELDASSTPPNLPSLDADSVSSKIADMAFPTDGESPKDIQTTKQFHSLSLPQKKSSLSLEKDAGAEIRYESDFESPSSLSSEALSCAKQTVSSSTHNVTDNRCSTSGNESGIGVKNYSSKKDIMVGFKSPSIFVPIGCTVKKNLNLLTHKVFQKNNKAVDAVKQGTNKSPTRSPPKMARKTNKQSANLRKLIEQKMVHLVSIFEEKKHDFEDAINGRNHLKRLHHFAGKDFSAESKKDLKKLVRGLSKTINLYAERIHNLELCLEQAFPVIREGTSFASAPQAARILDGYLGKVSDYLPVVTNTPTKLASLLMCISQKEGARLVNRASQTDPVDMVRLQAVTTRRQARKQRVRSAMSFVISSSDATTIMPTTSLASTERSDKLLMEKKDTVCGDDVQSLQATRPSSSLITAPVEKHSPLVDVCVMGGDEKVCKWLRDVSALPEAGQSRIPVLKSRLKRERGVIKLSACRSRNKTQEPVLPDEERDCTTKEVAGMVEELQTDVVQTVLPFLASPTNDLLRRHGNTVDFDGDIISESSSPEFVICKDEVTSFMEVPSSAAITIENVRSLNLHDFPPPAVEVQENTSQHRVIQDSLVLCNQPLFQSQPTSTVTKVTTISGKVNSAAVKCVAGNGKTDVTDNLALLSLPTHSRLVASSTPPSHIFQQGDGKLPTLVTSQKVMLRRQKMTKCALPSNNSNDNIENGFSPNQVRFEMSQVQEMRSLSSLVQRVKTPHPPVQEKPANITLPRVRKGRLNQEGAFLPQPPPFPSLSRKRTNFSQHVGNRQPVMSLRNDIPSSHHVHQQHHFLHQQELQQQLQRQHQQHQQITCQPAISPIECDSEQTLRVKKSNSKLLGFLPSRLNLRRTKKKYLFTSPKSGEKFEETGDDSSIVPEPPSKPKECPTSRLRGFLGRGKRH